MVGYIFLCNQETEKECLDRLLFGTDNPNVYQATLSHIQIGDFVFLYNYELGTLRGPFKALTECRANIESEAFKDARFRGYPFQVSVNDIAFDKPLPRILFNSIIEFYPNNPIYPKPKITEAALRTLLHHLGATNDSSAFTDELLSKSNVSISSHYIFKCNAVTGGRVFAENLFGASAGVFKSVVSRIQEGDVLLLWIIEEHKLYGIWKAKSRGQYKPGAFPEAGGNFPAVVYCDRILNRENGLDEATVRSLAPYDGNMPPYTLSYEHGQRLIRAFESTSNLSTTMQPEAGERVGKYLTEDGHWVKSHAEVIVDNWLFRNNFVHAYEHRVQQGTSYRKCDFYLPKYEIHVEYWGLIGNPTYDESRRQKLQFYHQGNIRLVELFPLDITMLSEVLRPKLAVFGVSF